MHKSESQRLVRQALESLKLGGDTFCALADSVLWGDNGQKRGAWVFIQIDSKAEDEIEWQVSEILSSMNIKKRWHHDSENNPIGSYDALRNLSKWLEKRALALFLIETDDDSYCGFIIRADKAATAKELATSANLTVW